MKLKAALDERGRCIHGWVDSFERRVHEHFRTTPSPDLTSIQTEIERIWSEVTVLATTQAPSLPSLSTLSPFTIDLFAEEELPWASDKRHREEIGTDSEAKAQDTRKDNRRLERVDKLLDMMRRCNERESCSSWVELWVRGILLMVSRLLRWIHMYTHWV